jgi:predicted amidophosphoribosyltransferase
MTILQTADIMIPVPLHNRKLRRGYNQVTTLRSAFRGIEYLYDSPIVSKVYSKHSKKKVFGQGLKELILF